MSLREILRWPDPRLSMVCTPVSEVTSEIAELAADMLETMYAAPGRGLAAPQVGVTMRLFVMDTMWKAGTPTPEVFINPKIVSRSAEVATQSEGCLSLPGVTAEITRPAAVRLCWLTLSGADREKTFDGFDAACVQHEMDHLEGIVTLDRLSADERARVLASPVAGPA